MSEHDEPAIAGSAVDAEHPWLGLDSFSEQSSGFFYGREDEIAELARRVQRKLLTVLFGQSGLGKTSILRAGIVPRLRPEGYCPVYVRLSYAPDAPPPSVQIKQAVLRATQSQGSWTRAGSAAAGETLWEFLHHRDDTLRDAHGRTLTPLLIFDQFEEIFTLAQADDGGRQHVAAFLADLADLVENRPPRALEQRMDKDDSAGDDFDFARTDYRILIALREDYLAHLESVKGVMPSITQNRMRLARMNGSQALAAVTRPGGKLVSEEVAEAIVRFTAGGSELVNAEVEPSLLSLICRELNNTRIAQGRAEISTDLLAGSHAGILAEFYARALQDQPPGVARFIEDELLTEGGFRENLAEERVLKGFADAGAAPGALAALVNRRLLRIEERLDVRRVELTHDVLCDVVRAARELRKERELLEQSQRQLGQQRERERATRKALVRARQVAAVCGVLAVGAIAGAAFGYVNMSRAQQTRSMAEHSRAEAEKLVSYLLDDFYESLAPIGQVQLVGELANRTASYYRALPAELQTAATQRNLALALTRLGIVRQALGKVDEAGQLEAEAIAIFERMARAAPPQEADTLGLAAALVAHAKVRFALGDALGAGADAERAVALVRPLGAAAQPSLAALRGASAALLYSGYVKMRYGEDSAGLALLLEACKLAQSSAAARADPVATTTYASASGWVQEVLVRQARYDEAERAAGDALAALAGVIAQRPNHIQALDIQARIESMSAVEAVIRKQASRALGWFDRNIERRLVLLRLDPLNRRATDSLSLAYATQSTAYFNLGRLADVIRAGEQALAPYGKVAPSNFQAGNLWGMAEFMAQIQAERGEHEAAQRLHAQSRRYAEASASTPYDHTLAALASDISGLGLVLQEGKPIASAASAALLARAQAALAAAPDKGEAEGAEQALRQASQLDAEVAYDAGDAARAEASSRLGLVLPRVITRDFDLDPWTLRTLHALALARLGRHADARADAAIAIRAQRAFLAAGADDQRLRFQMAQSLYAAALAQPGAGQPELKEAAALIAALPPELRATLTVQRWRGRIERALKEDVR